MAEITQAFATIVNQIEAFRQEEQIRSTHYRQDKLNLEKWQKNTENQLNELKYMIDMTMNQVFQCFQYVTDMVHKNNKTIRRNQQNQPFFSRTPTPNSGNMTHCHPSAQSEMISTNQPKQKSTKDVSTNTTTKIKKSTENKLPKQMSGSDQTKEVQVENKKLNEDRKNSTKQSKEVITKTKSETTSQNSETQMKTANITEMGNKNYINAVSYDDLFEQLRFQKTRRGECIRQEIKEENHKAQELRKNTEKEINCKQIPDKTQVLSYQDNAIIESCDDENAEETDDDGNSVQYKDRIFILSTLVDMRKGIETCRQERNSAGENMRRECLEALEGIKTDLWCMDVDSDLQAFKDIIEEELKDELAAWAPKTEIVGRKKQRQMHQLTTV